MCSNVTDYLKTGWTCMRLWTNPNSPHMSWAQETRSLRDLWWCLMILLIASLSMVCTSVSSSWPAPAECKEVAGQGWSGGLAQFLTWEIKFKGSSYPTMRGNVHEKLF